MKAKVCEAVYPTPAQASGGLYWLNKMAIRTNVTQLKLWVPENIRIQNSL